MNLFQVGVVRNPTPVILIKFSFGYILFLKKTFNINFKKCNLIGQILSFYPEITSLNITNLIVIKAYMIINLEVSGN